MLQYFWTNLQQYISDLYIPTFRWTDLIEILIVAFLIYEIMLWMRNTRAWSLLRGMLVIVAFIALAAIFNMTTILWIVKNLTPVVLTAIVIILQPELRNAVESIGQRNFLNMFYRLASVDSGRFSDRTVNEIVRACTAMAKVKTGALIVIEQNTPMAEYERTGIEVDGIVTSQLLINIFEKNTPLHDGAVIVRGDRVTSATCYLPLSENRLDKDLGTRHRAGVGISEVTDSLTIIVSEETGAISTAYKGALTRDVSQAQLRETLTRLQGKEDDDRRSLFSRKGKEDASEEK